MSTEQEAIVTWTKWTTIALGNERQGDALGLISLIARDIDNKLSNIQHAKQGFA
jgi:hypothetical protein